MKSPHLLGIAGPSCSGKSTLARAVAAHYAALDPLVLSMDAYYRDLSGLSIEERAAVNFDSPEAFEHELLLGQVRDLAAHRPVSMPVYDFTTHTRAGTRPVRWTGRLLIVEGILTLHWPTLNALFDSRVYVDLDDATALARRIARDTRERGRTPESVAKQFQESVTPMADAHCRPSRAAAHRVLDGSGAPEALAGELRDWLAARI